MFSRNGWTNSINFFGGSGRGGSGDDAGSDDNDEKDPFENFDFNRFRPRSTPNRSEKSSSPSGSNKDSNKNFNENFNEGTDKDTAKKDDEEKEPPRRSSGPTGNRGPRSPFDFSQFNGSNFGGLNGGKFGGGNGGGNIPQINLPRPSRGAIFAIIIGILIVLLFIALPTIANFWTDVIWYDQVKQAGVFWTRFWAEIITFAIGLVITFVLIMVNVRIARRFGPRGPVINANNDNVLATIVGGSLRLLNWAFIIGAFIISLILAGAASSNWNTILTFLNAAPWTDVEQIFNRTIGYYVFELPFFSFIQGWLVGLFIVTLIATAVVYGLNFALSGQNFSFTRPIKVHLSILGAVILGLFAWGYQLSNSQLVYSTRGYVPGASATDVEAQTPANDILTVIVALAAIALLVNIFIKNRRLSYGLGIGAIAVWLVGTIVVGSIYPSVYQSLTVQPNEITKESKYIQNTINSTRKAYGIDQVQVSQISGNGSISQADIQNNPYIQQNARLWDYGVTKQVYDQKETLKPYYTFDDVDIDRYNVSITGGNPTETQLLLSARQLTYSGLTANARSWQNLHLQFTHGYGIQVSPVNATDGSGQPANLINQNFPISTTVAPLNVTQPRIYFGTTLDTDGTNSDYALIDTKLKEFDYPFSDNTSANAEYTYEGDGIKLNSFFVKAAYALKLGDFNLLISDALGDNSKLLFKRNIQERAKDIAPFLLYNSDPYMVVADGKIYWVQDAYTYTGLYPHSDPVSRLSRNNGGVNYIRNSVKVVTDAYDGSISFYIADQANPDPIVHTYANIYPGLFKPFASMPDALKSHLRYPEDLLQIQSQMYLTYHVTDPTEYYNRNDLWQIPADPRSENQSASFRPYYLLTQLPNQNQKEFALIQPFKPQNKSNLISILAAQMDGANYGKLVAYNFPGSSNLYGPEQVYSLIQSNSDFSQQRTFLNQNGSNLTYGNLLILPVNNSVLYILPVYLSANNNPIPKLQFVTAAALTSNPNNPADTQLKTIVRPDLQTALADLIPAGSTATAPTSGQTSGTTGGSTTPAANPTVNSGTGATAGATVGTTGQPGTVNDLLRSAQTHFNNAEAARAKSDTATYQREYQAGLSDLNRVRQLLGGQ